MNIAVPASKLDDNSSELSKDIVEDLRIRNHEKLKFLRNKPPRWNETTQTHCLNFGGRVTMPSIKNFQLIHEHDGMFFLRRLGLPSRFLVR